MSSKNKTAWDIIGGAAGLASVFNVFGPQGGTRGKLNEFVSLIREKGIARSNRFLVVITPPKILVGMDSASTNQLALLCEAAAIPGLNISPMDNKRYGTGPIDKHATAGYVVDTNLSFIGDGEGYVHKFFYNWMQGIVKSDRLPTETSNRLSWNNLGAYEVEYKDNYSTIIDIYTYNEQDGVVLHIKLHDCWPTQMNDVALSWQENSDFQRIPVTFTYRHWEIYNIDEKFRPTEGRDTALSAIQRIVKGATIVQTIAAIRKPKTVGDYLQIVNNSKVIVKNIGGLL